MAKKPAKKAGGEDGDDDAGEAKGGGRKKLIIGLLAVVLLGGGAGAYFMLGKSKHGDEHAVVEKKPVAFVDIREMIVNLAPEPTGGDRQRFLKFKVSLEVKDPKAVTDVEPLLPRVEDIFQVFVRELRATDLEGSGGIHRLREELLRRVNVAVSPSRVDAVLFKEMIVQ